MPPWLRTTDLVRRKTIRKKAIKRIQNHITDSCAQAAEPGASGGSLLEWNPPFISHPDFGRL